MDFSATALINKTMAQDRQIERMKYASIRDWDKYAHDFDRHVSDALMGNRKVYITLSNHRQDTRGVMCMADIRLVLPIPR